MSTASFVNWREDLALRSVEEKGHRDLSSGSIESRRERDRDLAVVVWRVVVIDSPELFI